MHQRYERWEHVGPFRREPEALASALPGASIILSLEQAVAHELAQAGGGYRLCIAADIDPHWAGIGASVPLIERLISNPRLDAVEADPAEEQPAYR